MAHLQNGFGLLPPNIATIPWAECLDKPLLDILKGGRTGSVQMPTGV